MVDSAAAVYSRTSGAAGFTKSGPTAQAEISRLSAAVQEATRAADNLPGDDTRTVGLSLPLPAPLASKWPGLILGAGCPWLPMSCIWNIRCLPATGEVRVSIGDGSRGAHQVRLRCNRLKESDYLFRRSAALPAMAHRRENARGLIEDNGRNADAAAKRNQHHGTCNQLPRVPQLLAERALGGVLIVRISMTLRARGMVAPCAREVRAQRVAQDMVDGLRPVNMALDRQHLIRQRHQRKNNHHNARARRPPRCVRRGCGRARCVWSCVATVDHLARKRALIGRIYSRQSEIPVKPIAKNPLPGR